MVVKGLIATCHLHDSKLIPSHAETYHVFLKTILLHSLSLPPPHTSAPYTPSPSTHTLPPFFPIIPIPEVLRHHYETTIRRKELLPYLAIIHVRDMLIPPSERSGFLFQIRCTSPQWRVLQCSLVSQCSTKDALAAQYALDSTKLSSAVWSYSVAPSSPTVL